MPLARIALTVAASLLSAITLSSCASGATPPPNTQTTEDAREAAWGAERTRICLQNLTGANLQYEFRKNTVDDTGNWLSPNSGVLGPNAFRCGNAENTPLETITWVRFRADEPGSKWTYRVGFSDTSVRGGHCWFWSDDLQVDPDTAVANPYAADAMEYYDYDCFARGKRQLSGTARGGNYNLLINIDGALETFGSIRAYQANLRVLAP